jgi:hypothetical protein
VSRAGLFHNGQTLERDSKKRIEVSYRTEKKAMSLLKFVVLVTVLTFGATQLSFAQAGNPYAGGGGAGTTSGHPHKAQNNNRGPGKNPGGLGQGYQ